jgi:hypothetical protein
MTNDDSNGTRGPAKATANEAIPPVKAKPGTLVRAVRKIGSYDLVGKADIVRAAEKFGKAITAKTLEKLERGAVVRIGKAKLVLRILDQVLRNANPPWLATDEHLVLEDLFESMPQERAQAHPAPYGPESELQAKFDELIAKVKARRTSFPTRA